MNRSLTRIATVMAFVAATMSASVALADSRRAHVDPGGWSGAVRDGEISGRELVNYKLVINSGEMITVRLSSPNPGAFFKVYGPGDGPGQPAIADSSSMSGMVPETNVFNSVLNRTGTYTFSVYLTSETARSGSLAPYSIEFDILVPGGEDVRGGDTPLFQVRTRTPGGSLNVHTDPSIDAPRIGRFANGTILRDLSGCDADGGREWCEVMEFDGGLAGYVAREFLAKIRPHSAAPVTHALPAEPRPTSAPTPHIRANVSHSSDFFHVHLANPRGHLSVHADPTVHSVRVGRLPDGADLRNIGGCVENEGRTWCDVMLAGGGVSGWVAAEFLRDGHPPAAHVPSPASAPPLTGDFADGLAGGPDYWRVSLDRGGSSLRVHSQPSTNSPVVGRFANGSTLHNAEGCRINDGRRWCYVSSISGSVSGWVAGDFLVEGSAPGVAAHVPPPAPRVAPQPVPAVPAASMDPGYDMSGSLACVRSRDAAEAECDYGTVHEGSGNGWISINWPDGGSRVIYYEDGAPVYYDQSEADGGAQMRVTRDGSVFIVFVGEQRFVIPANLFAPQADEGSAVHLPLVPPPAGPDADALVEGTEFNAMAPIDCVRDRDAAPATCDAGAVREGNGRGYVKVFWPDGGSRVIYFENNTPVSYDQSEADGGAEMTVSQDGGTFTVFVGEARFVIPEALMAGG